MKDRLGMILNRLRLYAIMFAAIGIVVSCGGPRPIPEYDCNFMQGGMSAPAWIYETGGKTYSDRYVGIGSSGRVAGGPGKQKAAALDAARSALVDVLPKRVSSELKSTMEIAYSNERKDTYESFYEKEQKITTDAYLAFANTAFWLDRSSCIVYAKVEVDRKRTNFLEKKAGDNLSKLYFVLALYAEAEHAAPETYPRVLKKLDSSDKVLRSIDFKGLRAHGLLADQDLTYLNLYRKNQKWKEKLRTAYAEYKEQKRYKKVKNTYDELQKNYTLIQLETDWEKRFFKLRWVKRILDKLDVKPLMDSGEISISDYRGFLQAVQEDLLGLTKWRINSALIQAKDSGKSLQERLSFIDEALSILDSLRGNHSGDEQEMLILREEILDYKYELLQENVVTLVEIQKMGRDAIREDAKNRNIHLPRFRRGEDIYKARLKYIDKARFLMNKMATDVPDKKRIQFLKLRKKVESEKNRILHEYVEYEFNLARSSASVIDQKLHMGKTKQLISMMKAGNESMRLMKIKKILGSRILFHTQVGMTRAKVRETLGRPDDRMDGHYRYRKYWIVFDDTDRVECVVEHWGAMKVDDDIGGCQQYLRSVPAAVYFYP